METNKETGAQDPTDLEKILQRAKISLDVLRMWGGVKGEFVYSQITGSKLLSDELFMRFLSHVFLIGEALGPDEAERIISACPDIQKLNGRYLDFDAFNKLLCLAHANFLASESLTQEDVERLNCLLQPDAVGSFLFEFLDTVATLARVERIDSMKS